MHQETRNQMRLVALIGAIVLLSVVLFLMDFWWGMLSVVVASLTGVTSWSMIRVKRLGLKESVESAKNAIVQAGMTSIEVEDMIDEMVANGEVDGEDAERLRVALL